MCMTAQSVTWYTKYGSEQFWQSFSMSITRRNHRLPRVVYWRGSRAVRLVALQRLFSLPNYRVIQHTITHAPSITPVTFPVNECNDVIAIDETRPDLSAGVFTIIHTDTARKQFHCGTVQAARRSRSGDWSRWPPPAGNPATKRRPRQPRNVADQVMNPWHMDRLKTQTRRLLSSHSHVPDRFSLP